MSMMMRAVVIAILLLVSLCSFAEGDALIVSSAKSIEDEAFYENASVKTVVLHENIERVGSRAFAQCNNLAEVYCFSNTVRIDESAFEGNYNIVVYCYQGSTMEQLAQKYGFEVRRPICFEVECDTQLNGAVGLPITWKVKWLAPPPDSDLVYTWTVMRAGNEQPVIQDDTNEGVFSFTPTLQGTYTVNLTIHDSLNSDSKSGEALDVAPKLYFGCYEQDGKASTIDPLEWSVLDVSNGEALLITKKIIRNDSFFNPEWIKYKYTYWAESCVGSSSSVNWWGVIKKDSMKITGITPEHVPLADRTFGKEEDIFYVHSRYWLNNVFYASAFNDNEKERIIPVHNVTEDNPEYGTESGPDSVDKVFFLSYPEVIKYMPTAASRKTTMTNVALYQSNSNSGGNIGRYWWLRTAGAKQWFAMHIQGSDGGISIYGSDVGHNNVGYRPCIRIRVGG